MVTQRWLAFAISHQADAVGVEFCCSACVFRTEVRPHHATPDTVALAEGTGAHQV